MSQKTEKLFRRMSRIMSGGNSWAHAKRLKDAWGRLSHIERGKAHEQIDMAIAQNDREQLELAIKKGIDVRLQPRKF